ncbi:nuclear GTPase SLIP-GC-like isoform X3 [Channa argus]|uniref:nuclear GTPase SLIP-GC-like isoform X2 n=1 Tax=Channa argus TaxID=215402 RepID=UPI003521BFD5
MDDFVRKKLTEWDLSDWIQRFKDGCIDEKRFYYLNNSDIKELIPTVGPRAQFREHHRQLKHFHQKPKEPAASVQHFHLKPKEPAASVQIPQHFHLKPKEPPASVQVQPSTSYTGKRKLNPEGESSYSKPPTCKRQCNTSSQTNSDIMFEVKKIMKEIDERLGKQGDTPFNAFLRAKINDLETDKRELVGVFGKTGAGKSSLINAIIREENLLPSGTGSACTSVMIKVEASNQYEAHVEFITEEEWKEELWTFDNFLKDSSSQRIYDDDDDDDNDDREEYREKLSAVYGEEWKQKSPEELMDKKYFKEIPEFFIRKKKIVPCESAADLSKKIIKYTRSESEEGSGKILKRCYWPLVKCVTVRVPCSDLLQHVTLVDLPGNGDCNKSRDTMWKELVTCCSTVWIVTDMNRAVSEKEPWEILKTACSLMGNGGECQKIHFICTKSDLTEVSTASRSAKEVRELRIKKNKETKDKVWKRFKQLHKIKEHFSDSCLKVFTVSAKEFVEDKCAKPENEISKLQEFLQNLNDRHSETLNYVSGAYGILSLIQGVRCRDVAEIEGREESLPICTFQPLNAAKKFELCQLRRELEEIIICEINKVENSMLKAYNAFEKCLSLGVTQSIGSCLGLLKSVLYPRGVKGRAFHRTLKCVVEKSGTHKPKNKSQININLKLSSRLTESINEEFRKTFPNEGRCKPFNGVISRLSLDIERFIKKYKDAKLQLTYLMTEEKKIKTKLNQTIRERKKRIYSSLMEKIEKTMQKCYTEAAQCQGKDMLKKMRETIENHVNNSKNVMFEEAKKVMLDNLGKLMEEIVKTLESTLKEAITLSLRTDGYSVPDFSKEFEIVKQYYTALTPD